VKTLATELRVRNYVTFGAWVTFVHCVTYLAVGTLAYSLIYKEQIDAGLFDPWMRNPHDPAEWRHVETWLIPAQVLRGLLFGAALVPFLKTLAEWSFRRRFLALLGLLLVFSVWSVTMPGPGSIEGWVYLKPNAGPTSPSPFLGFVEVPAQLAAFALLVSWWIGRYSQRP